ncbi:MAG: hypothetical protein ACFFD6_02995 [Candidatus Thorarchaeota archaeon]
MDFQLALDISGILVIAIGAFSVLVYASRLRNVYSEVTSNTRRALLLFGLSAITLVMLGTAFLYIPNTVRMWAILFFIFIINTQSHIIFRTKQLILGTAIASTLTAVVVMGSIAFLGRSDLILGSILIYGFAALALAIRAVQVSQTPLAGAILTITSLALFTTLAIDFGVLIAEPRYFIVLTLPIVVTSAILVSMLRPWRYMISGSVGLFVFASGIPLIIAGLISNDFLSWSYVSVATFVGIAGVAGLTFFMKQALETRARTPLYISLVLLGVILLVTTHANAWSIAQEFGAWDINFLFIDWILGVLIVAAFVLAGAYGLYSENTKVAVREIMLLIVGSFVMLGNRNLYVTDTELDILYIPLALFIGIGVVQFGIVSNRVRKAGSTGAALRFFFFVIAALIVGIIAMFSDIFLNAGLYVPMLIMMIGSGFMLFGTSPTVTSALQRNDN